MAKAPSRFLTLRPREAGATATQWIWDARRRAVLDGRLKAGTRLPSTRDLANIYGLARVAPELFPVQNRLSIAGRLTPGAHQPAASAV